MGIIGSLFGASVGWWTLGPIGAVLGLIIGHVAEETSAKKQNQSGNMGSVAHDGFIASLLVLMAAVMKADGRVLKSELEYVKKYLIRAIGEVKAAEALIVLRDILNRNIPLSAVCHQISNNIGYSDRLELMHLLLGIAKSDGDVPESEILVLQNIASLLGVAPEDFASLMGMYEKGIESAYKILELNSNSSDAEVKKAYRKMALKYHPDKVLHLGEEFQKSAKEKFQKVGLAYEQIKKERGMK